MSCDRSGTAPGTGHHPCASQIIPYCSPIVHHFDRKFSPNGRKFPYRVKMTAQNTPKGVLNRGSGGEIFNRARLDAGTAVKFFFTTIRAAARSQSVDAGARRSEARRIRLV
jgi:hypothetical protein